MIIKTSIKLVGFFIVLFFFNDTFIKSFLPSLLVFCANYCVIVTTNFNRCCCWLRFAVQPKHFFFYSGHPDVCTAIIMIIMLYALRDFYMCILTPFADVIFLIIPTFVCFDQSSLLEPKTTPILNVADT